MDEQGSLADLLELRTGNGVEVEVEVIGTVHVVTARIPWVQIDAAEVNHPKERREIADDGEIDDAGGGVFDGADVNPIGAGDRRAFLEEELASGAVGVTFHDHGAADEVREEVGGDVGVIAEEVAFGDSELRPERFF